jgi:hypothetical protein
VAGFMLVEPSVRHGAFSATLNADPDSGV